MGRHGNVWQVPGYTDVRELGSGASGRVVLARHDADDTHVAIKYLNPRLLSDADVVARFRDEARLIASVDDPHTVKLYEYVESEHGAAIVMELVDGPTLRRLIKQEGATGPEAALLVLKGSLLGLAAAHRLGVVHRDFKPENVIVTADGDSKLVDFGVAVLTGQSGEAVGTPPYMAPEQWANAPASPATDVYAATVTFFECLAGDRPFHGDTMAALAYQHQNMPPPVGRVPEPLRGLVEHGMAKRPEERPASAEEFLGELEVSARAAYGEDWEERGHAALRTLVSAAHTGVFSLVGTPPDVVGSALAQTKLAPAMKLAVAGGLAVTTAAAIIGAFAIINRPDVDNLGAPKGARPTASVSGAGPVAPTGGQVPPTASPKESVPPTAEPEPVPPDPGRADPRREDPRREDPGRGDPGREPARQPVSRPATRPTAPPSRPGTRPVTRPTRPPAPPASEPDPGPADSGPPAPPDTGPAPGGDPGPPVRDPRPEPENPPVARPEPEPENPPVAQPPPSSSRRQALLELALSVAVDTPVLGSRPDARADVGVSVAGEDGLLGLDLGVGLGMVVPVPFALRRRRRPYEEERTD